MYRLIKFMSNIETVLTLKQQSFCKEYLKDFNGTQAAIRAKYSKRTAAEQAARLLGNVKVQDYLSKFTEKADSKAIMDVTEILEGLTALARGQVQEECIVVVSTGNFKTKAVVESKQVSPKDRAKAYELLGKANAMFTEKVQHLEPPVIQDDIPKRIDEDEENDND